MSQVPATRYQQLLTQIETTYQQGRREAVQAVNQQLVQTYWQLGQNIVEFEQQGEAKAQYGKALIVQLAQDLTLRFGKGFSRTNLVYMRLFYLHYSKSQKPSDFLSWSHYVELLKIEATLAQAHEMQRMVGS